MVAKGENMYDGKDAMSVRGAMPGLVIFWGLGLP